MTTGISLTGLATGLDTEAIVEALIAIERQPRVRMQQREEAIKARQTALRDIATRLRNLKNAAADLRSVALWADTQTVSTNDETKLSARRISGAGPGGYQVEVLQLARAEQRTYDFTPSATPTTITLEGGGGDPVTIELEAGATLDDLVAAINGNAEAPVYAVNVDGRLVLSSRKTGAANGFTATGAGLVEDVAAAKVGLDAQFTVDGGPVQTASTNVVTSAIPGVELTFKAVTGGPMTVTVGEPKPDTAAIKKKIEAFVEQYNSAVSFIREKLTEERDSNDPKKGVLRNDAMLTGLLGTLRQAITEVFAGNPGDVDQLIDIGVSTGASNADGSINQNSVQGLLVLNSSKLEEKLSANLLDVRRLLGGISGVDGFAQRIEGILGPVTQADGVLDARLDSADSELRRIRDQMNALDERLEQREERLRMQFATLERLLANSQSQGMWLSGQLAALLG